MKGKLDGIAGASETGLQGLFYALFLPLGAVVNLVLGLVVLTGMRPQGDFYWLQLGTGTLCCVIAGWLAGSAWSKSYWSRIFARQVTVWGRIADAFFTWAEDLPVPAESLRRLSSSLEDAAPSTERH